MLFRKMRIAVWLGLVIGMQGLPAAVRAADAIPAAGVEFPSELVDFVPYEGNPLFAGTGRDTWDQMIRERGWILHDGGQYHMWYTGYKDTRPLTMHLGYATSPDGLHWTRWPGNPIFDKAWVEDMQVLKQGGMYSMFAEGLRDERIERLTSTDRVHWQLQGDVEICDTAGKPLKPAHYGTPTVWVEGATSYLFYEESDRAIWLATSKDNQHWRNFQDEPVIACGPEPFDRAAVAMDQVLKYRGRYYGYYHALAEQGSGNWTVNVAVSADLVHWKKYLRNPIIDGDKSSPVLVSDGRQYRLYTMHPDVRLYLPKTPPK